MIHVDRSTVPVPPSLLDAGVAERRRAVAFFADPGNHTKSFAFKAYKARDVCDALNQLFHGKCAYCESSYAPTQPADIEHFRPKAAVMIEPRDEQPFRRKPGYYWLAAEWDNLLPSCIDCNRARTQESADIDTAMVRGKENRFPLADEAKRSVDPEDFQLLGEEPLLLHPCRDRPEEHLEFLAGGLIREQEGSARGRATITVLGLQRKALKEARRSGLMNVVEKMHAILALVSCFDDKPTPELAGDIELQLRWLRQLARATRPYSGIVGHYVTGFEAALKAGTARAYVSDLIAAVTEHELV